MCVCVLPVWYHSHKHIWLYFKSKSASGFIKRLSHIRGMSLSSYSGPRGFPFPVIHFFIYACTPPCHASSSLSTEPTVARSTLSLMRRDAHVTRTHSERMVFSEKKESNRTEVRKKQRMESSMYDEKVEAMETRDFTHTMASVFPSTVCL